MTSESRSKFFGGADVSQGMTAILVCLASAVAALVQFTLTPKVSAGESTSTWLACAKANPAKRQWEVFNLKYGVFWVGCFAVIIAFSLYEAFDEVAYFTVCFGLCVPIFLFPLVSVDPSEARLAVGQRYGVRANVWIAVYSFIGNYWLSSSLEYVSFVSSSPRECICVPGYPRARNMSASYTHYFYGVLGAKYTFPSWRLNDVPIALIGATIFYFSLYHALSNLAIRKVVTSFEAGAARSLTLVVLVGAMAYAVAFAETLSISGFPYYEFEDRDMAYVFGSAFYGIYFIVSFPMFYLFGEWPQQDDPHRATKGSAEGLWSAAVNSMGGSMLILCLLDFVRLALGKALVIKG